MYTKFDVATRSRKYPVIIGVRILGQLNELLGGLGDRVFIITDDTVSRFHLTPLLLGLNSSDIEVSTWTIPTGEHFKNLETGVKIYSFLEENLASRSDTILALGGGVIGDIAGYVASTFKRGMRLVQVPTTLLSQVDSSLGGKTGINLSSGKNLVGTFYQPHAVFADVQTLSTLPNDEYISGLAEVVKYAVIMDRDFVDILIDKKTEILRRDQDTIAFIVERCLRNKARIVAEDETEEVGKREILNFGHTIGHAIETVTNHRFSHGQAVAIGMVEEARFALKMRLLDNQSLESLILLLSMFGLPLDIPSNIDVRDLEVIIKQDKKMRQGRLNLPILVALGKTQIKAIDSPFKLIS